MSYFTIYQTLSRDIIFLCNYIFCLRKNSQIGLMIAIYILPCDMQDGQRSLGWQMWVTSQLCKTSLNGDGDLTSSDLEKKDISLWTDLSIAFAYRAAGSWQHRCIRLTRVA